MVDTKRDLDAFTNASTGLFKDNTTGLISAQDLRDFTVTAFAGLYSTTVEVLATTDVTGVVGTMHVLDMSNASFTGDLDFILPTTAAVGDRIGVMISAGDDLYELDLHTVSASGDTINGVNSSVGTASWSRLFITGETVIFRCVTANSAWIVEHDGRIPQSCQLEDAGGTACTTAESQHIEVDTSVYDNANIGDIATPDWGIQPRRTGRYWCRAFVRLTLNDQNLTAVYVMFDNNAKAGQSGYPAVNGTACQMSVSAILYFDTAVDTTIEVQVYHNFGSDVTPNTGAGNRASITVLEVFE